MSSLVMGKIVTLKNKIFIFTLNLDITRLFWSRTSYGTLGLFAVQSHCTVHSTMCPVRSDAQPSY